MTCVNLMSLSWLTRDIYAVKDYPSYVETLPSSYVESLPPSAHPYLELELDWDHCDLEKDLREIAHYMLDWEEKLATYLELTRVDIHDIKETYTSKPVLQRLACSYESLDLHVTNVIWYRREALRRWKNRATFKPTYGNLLGLFVKAGHAMGAEVVCDVLRKKSE